MRILFVVRPSGNVRSGGDLTQARFTRRALEAVGVRVDVAATLEPDARGYDLAHIFGAYDPEVCEVQMAACRRSGVSVALSPIWWHLLDFFVRSKVCERILAGRIDHIEARLARLRETKTERLVNAKAARKYAQRLDLQRRLMHDADVLLPNSTIEAYHYRRFLKLYDRPIVVVHQAVDVEPVPQVQAARRGVICVARIEPKKNQAMLLYALREVDVEVTLVGACFEPEYMDLCRRWMTPRVRVLGDVSRQDVLRLLAGSAVHVLPSWAETPGIANLEAAIAGAHVVASDDGTECEYFGEFASYVDPENPASMRATIERLLAQPPREPRDELTERLEPYTLEAVARQTMIGYRRAISLRNVGAR